MYTKTDEFVLRKLVLFLSYNPLRFFVQFPLFRHLHVDWARLHPINFLEKEVIALLKVSHDGMSLEIIKLMLIPVNNLYYLIKLLSLFPACVIYSPFVALSVFVVLSNFCRIIKLLPSWGIEHPNSF